MLQLVFALNRYDVLCLSAVNLASKIASDLRSSLIQLPALKVATITEAHAISQIRGIY